MVIKKFSLSILAPSMLVAATAAQNSDANHADVDAYWNP